MRKRHLKSSSINSVIIASTVILTILLVAISITCSSTYRELNNIIAQRDELQTSARNLREGSDYLTEQVRLFVITEDRTYLDNFFYEANVNRRREMAIESISTVDEESSVKENLEKALQYSNALMEDEKFAMTLIAIKNDVPPENYNIVLKDVVIEEDIKNLNAESLQKLAQETVFGESYLEQKTLIYGCIDTALDETLDDVNSARDDLASQYSTLIVVQNALILAVFCMIIVFISIFTTYYVYPLNRFTKHMKKQETLEVNGAEELQILAATYNAMLSKIKSDQEELSYEASHDPLTGLYNRKIFEDMRASLDNFTMLVLDIDDFKIINDTYGHEGGDKILQKVGRTLVKNFRSEDYVCRIGGDEFAVIMLNVSSNLKYLIESKVEAIQISLADTSDGLPACSVSMGIAFSDRENPSDDIYVDCDKALYSAKNSGKGVHTYY